MFGLMQDWPLLVSRFIEYAEKNHGEVEVISMVPEGGKIRTNYSNINFQSKKAAQALIKLGICEGDRVGTLAWNTHRHVEAWFGISGMGAITHTINPRLFPEQLVYIINHAEDRIVFVDITFVPVLEKIAAQLKTVEHFVIMVGREHMPETNLENVICYEEMLGAEDGHYDWPVFDENTACSLCYTSGTTGNPKGVLYSHRSNYLHTMSAMGKDGFNIGAMDCMMPVVPMFHANAWGLPYGAAGLGTKLVLIGPHHDAETLHKLIIDEGVTTTAAVPTIWSGMLSYLQANSDLTLGKLDSVVIGGSAVPRNMIKIFAEKFGVWVSHAWGMTETSPLGTMCNPKFATSELKGEDMYDLQSKQGRGFIGIEMTITDEDGNHLPWDGETQGNLKVRGPWVIKEYFKGGKSALDENGWFDTGDVAIIDELGFMKITDRSKDMIKSGGEWISSIDLENAAVSHPDILEAAIIGHPHPKWEERPLLVVVLKEGKKLTLDEVNAHLELLVVKWWLPSGMVEVKEIPHTATGKISKKDLRLQVADYQFPDTR